MPFYTVAISEGGYYLKCRNYAMKCDSVINTPHMGSESLPHPVVILLD